MQNAAFDLFNFRSKKNSGIAAFPDLRLRNPHQIFCAEKIEDIVPVLASAQASARAGNHVAGFVSYEASYAFLPEIPMPLTGNLPLAFFAVFRNAESLEPPDLAPADESGPVRDFQFQYPDKKEYIENVETIREQILHGEVYQVNYTDRVQITSQSDFQNQFFEIGFRQRCRFGLFASLPFGRIFSFSPELFFACNGNSIHVRPMKGTSARGITPQKDYRLKKALSDSRKDLSENHMIVDLMRNDLGRICTLGKVQVKLKSRIEGYPTLWQSVSEIRGELLPALQLSDIFAALFPCGSVTGAPKISAMQSISRLEKSARTVYTGALGYLHGESAIFSVGIRTLFEDNDRKIVLGSGSGIVWDSAAEKEYDEMKQKTRFLSAQNIPRGVFTTGLFQDGKLKFEKAHRYRVVQGCRRFGFTFQKNLWNSLLARLYEEQYSGGARIEIFPDGSLNFIKRNLQRTKSWQILVSAPGQFPIDFPGFKVFPREDYNAAFEWARQQGCDDTLLVDSRGRVCETTIASIFIKKDNLFYTPPASQGNLLPGISRARVLRRFPHKFIESELTLQDLKNADRIYALNALRGWIAVKLVFLENTSSE
ncbi:MAG: chorismate-binding protein [Leptospiraceae bacterium]|nr:chorismate-binding protein [Leptospiraceae bacterium]